MCPLGRNANPTTQLAQQPSTLMTNCRPNDGRTKKYRKKVDLHFMHDSRTWRQRTGVKTRSHPPTLLDFPQGYYLVCPVSGLQRGIMSQCSLGRGDLSSHCWGTWTGLDWSRTSSLGCRWGARATTSRWFLVCFFFFFQQTQLIRNHQLWLGQTWKNELISMQNILQKCSLPIFWINCQ